MRELARQLATPSLMQAVNRWGKGHVNGGDTIPDKCRPTHTPPRKYHDQVVERADGGRICRVADGSSTDLPGDDRSGRSGQGTCGHAGRSACPGGCSTDGGEAGRERRHEEDLDQRHPGCEEVQEEGKNARERSNGVRHEGAGSGRRGAQGLEHQVILRCETATAEAKLRSW